MDLRAADGTPVDPDAIQPGSAQASMMTHAPGLTPAPLPDLGPSWVDRAMEDSRLSGQDGGLTPDAIQRKMDLVGGFVGGTKLGKVSRGLTAYHASPYNFNEFKLNPTTLKGGEGGGRYGLYFSSDPRVADAYADEYLLGIGGVGEYVDKTGKFWSKNKLYNKFAPFPSEEGFLGKGGDLYRDRAHVLEEVLSRIQEGEEDPYDISEIVKSLPNSSKAQALAEKLQGLGLTSKEATQYKVNINAKLPQFLQWHEPLDEQTPYVQEALEPLIFKQANKLGQDPDRYAAFLTGRAFYEALSSPRQPGKVASESGQVATKALLDHGIPGATYPEMETSGAKGTRNYIVFNDKLISILQKYGMAALVGSGYKHFSTTPVDHDPFEEQ